MDMTFFNRIAKNSASTNSRNGIRNFVLENPECLKYVVTFGTDFAEHSAGYTAAAREVLR